MTTRKTVMVVLAFTGGIAAASAGFHLQRLMVGSRDPAATSLAPVPVMATAPMADAAVIGRRRPDFRLPDPDGVERGPADWDGKVLVLNFWATWCPPCLEEMPAFMALQERYREQGVQFLGVALDEADNVRRFVAELGLNYPTVYGQEQAMEVGTAYGNRIGALPYTAIIDRDGNIARTHVGALDEAAAAALIEVVLAR